MKRGGLHCCTTCRRYPAAATPARSKKQEVPPHWQRRSCRSVVSSAAPFIQLIIRERGALTLSPHPPTTQRPSQAPGHSARDQATHTLSESWCRTYVSGLEASKDLIWRLLWTDLETSG
ncbi:unnamed protein product [Ectocarpus sp. 12 AP-2014]